MPDGVVHVRVQPLICETRRIGTEASGFEYYAFAC